MEWVTKYWIEWIFGVFAAVLVALFNNLKNKLKAEKVEQDAIKSGLQALLRAQLIADYERYAEKGFAPVYARDNFENAYKQYEKLGENGVIKDIHAKFLALPTKAQEVA